LSAVYYESHIKSDNDSQSHQARGRTNTFPKTNHYLEIKTAWSDTVPS